MCGRYSFNLTSQIIKDNMDIIIPQQLEFNFNIAPTNKAYVVLNVSPNKISKLHWGLVPNWKKESKLTGKLINARIESITEKPSFNQLITKKRCLVLADSFYEWEKISKENYPYRIFPKNNRILVMAGIWDETIIENKKVKTFSIITTKPNDFMKNIHHRMPLILDTGKKQKMWLYNNSKLDEILTVEQLDENYLEMYPISNQVNFVKSKGSQLHQEIPKQGKLF